MQMVPQLRWLPAGYYWILPTSTMTTMMTTPTVSPSPSAGWWPRCNVEAAAVETTARSPTAGELVVEEAEEREEVEQEEEVRLELTEEALAFFAAGEERRRRRRREAAAASAKAEREARRHAAVAAAASDQERNGRKPASADSRGSKRTREQQLGGTDGDGSSGAAGEGHEELRRLEAQLDARMARERSAIGTDVPVR
jgi:hypothetical protein